METNKPRRSRFPCDRKPQVIYLRVLHQYFLLLPWSKKFLPATLKEEVIGEYDEMRTTTKEQTKKKSKKRFKERESRGVG